MEAKALVSRGPRTCGASEGDSSLLRRTPLSRPTQSSGTPRPDPTRIPDLAPPKESDLTL